MVVLISSPAEKHIVPSQDRRRKRKTPRVVSLMLWPKLYDIAL